MNPSSNHSDELFSYLEKAYSFLITLDQRQDIWVPFVKFIESAVKGFNILALILLIANPIYWLSYQHYSRLSTPVNISRLELVFLVGGFISAFWAAILTVYVLSRIIERISSAIKNAINFSFQKAIKYPLERMSRNTLEWVLHSKLWVLSRRYGEEVGYKYILYPALSFLEPDTDKELVSHFALEQLPPFAYAESSTSEETLKRYFNFGDKVLLPLWIISFIVFSIILATFVSWAVSWIPSPSKDIILLVIFFATTLLAWIPFSWGCAKPIFDRQHAWALCKRQHYQKTELEKQAQELEKDVTQRLTENLEKLQKVYVGEWEQTQQVVKRHEQVLQNLQHLAEQPNVDGKTLDSLLFLIEFALDQRRKEDTHTQFIEQKRTRRYELVKDLAIGFLFLILGLMIGGR